MSAMQRNKGKAGERELAAVIHGAAGWEVRRRVRQHAGDSDLEGVPGWCVECKRHARATRSDIATWWAQTVDQAGRGGEKPVLFYRLDHADWRAVWGLGLHLGAEWTGYAMTIEGSAQAWAATARELLYPRGVHESV
jgi:Holliday junction resolvase